MPRQSKGANRLIMATTRAATFSAKIRTLSEFHSRILSNQQPSNAEIVTTLRYFQQTLIGFLKDIPPENNHLFRKFNAEVQRSNFFPNLSYSGLFYGIVNLLDAFPLLSSGHVAIGEAILDTLKALYFFLDKDCIDQMAYVIASQLGVLPSELDKKIVRLLCECILPYSLCETTLSGLSVPAVLMLILQHSQDSSLHTMVVECLLARRENVYNDLLAVIAKGTSESRIPAANLLFHYWPIMNPTILHRKSIQYKIQAWSLPSCQNTTCVERGSSVKYTYDPVVCAKYGDTAPPMALCKSCMQNVATDQPMIFICQPMPATNVTVCQNKGCESSNRMAIGTCFAENCIRSHNHAPLRLCQECFVALHSSENTQSHIRHKGAGCTWGTPIERSTIEAVVKLLKETSCQLEGNETEGKRPKWLRQLEGGQALGKDFDALSDERRMLSRFGIWIMAALCPPTAEAPSHAVGYIMSMIFQWFSTTALLPNDSMGASIEQLKTDFALDWLNLAIENHHETFVAILQPDLPEFSQVGGVWDKWCSRKEQMKEGLSKLLSLMPYDVISFDTWNRVIPNWLKAISEEIDEDDLQELKVLLCKIFEPDLCPLPFDQCQVFEFVSTRLTNGVYEDILNALDWLHLLSRLNIRIPLTMLLKIFEESLQKLHEVTIPRPAEENDLEEDLGPLAAEVVMVDIIAQQVTLNEIKPHEINPCIIEQMFNTAALLLQYSNETLRNHSCQNPETDQFSDCVPCQQAGFLYQVLMHLTEQCCPKDEKTSEMETNTTKMNDWLADTQMSDSTTNASQHMSNMTSPRNSSVYGVLSPVVTNLDANKSIETASNKLKNANGVEINGDEVSCVLPNEYAEMATPTYADESIQMQTPNVCDAQTLKLLKRGSVITNNEFWDTSVGSFRFKIDELPAQLKLIYSLVVNIDREIDPDVQYFLLNILKYLCLHCNTLNNARREHRGFLIWIQENYLIPKLWTLLRSDYAQVGQLAVRLLIHAITLPCGEEVYWNTVNADFTNQKWEVRFKAERAYVVAHLIIPVPIKASRLLQTCLSCIFSHLIVSTHDPNMSVAQRTILALKALPQTSLNLMCLCLESQFDSCILDRPLIINRINLLTTVVPEANILTWDFFIQRFETLALEAQLKNHIGGDGNVVQDLLHSDPMSDLYQRKIMKARESLNEVDSVRSIVKSLRENSLKHQLTINAKLERAQVKRAHHAVCSRGRRGATCNDDVARYRLRKVLMMVRVVRCFRNFTDRLYSFSPIQRLRSSNASPVDFADGASNNNDNVDRFPLNIEKLEHQQPTTMHQLSSIATASIVSEAATIASVAVVAGTISANDFTPFTPAEENSFSVPLPSRQGQRPTGGGPVGYARMREFTDEESNLCLLLNRVVDMENPERHTLYLTVVLFVHFLCNKKGGGASNEKVNAKKQSLLLRHFNTLLGYSNSEKCFTIPPYRLRKAAVCNAFLTGLPEILDNNLMIGNQMLPIIVQLLLHLPSSQKFASDHSAADYSLGLLKQSSRHSWLHSLIIILYKYRCDTTPISDTICKLMMITVTTLEAHCHICDDKPKNDSQFQRNIMEFDFLSADSSENDSGEDEVIHEEELDDINVYQKHSSSNSLDIPVDKNFPPRSESLQFNKGDASDQQQKFIQPAIIEPPKFQSGPTTPKFGGQRRARRRHRSKRHNRNNDAANSEPVSRLTCGFCGERLETFDEETICLCLISLSTFLHREPVMAAPILFRVIKAVTRFIDTPQFSWHETNIFVPGNSRSTAKQLIRVIFHQLSGSGIALQLFDSCIKNVNSFWSTISFSLADFNELNPVALLQCLLEDVNENWPPRLARILHNCAAYVPTISSDAYLSNWNSAVSLLEGFFRRYYSQLMLEGTSNANNNVINSLNGHYNNSSGNLNGVGQSNSVNNINQQQNKFSSGGNSAGTNAKSALIISELKSAMIIMTSVLHVHNFATFKSSCALIENYAKWLAEALHHCSVDLRDLLIICTTCNRSLIRERDKQCITRVVCCELIHAIKFKCELFEKNYMTIVELILQDFGEDVHTNSIYNAVSVSNAIDGSDKDELFNEWSGTADDTSLYNTGASEAIRPFMSEILEFIADLHVLSKLKKQTNSDRICGDLKAALSEVVALEMSRPTVRDSRTVMRFIPWLYSPPSLAQTVPGAFVESVTYVRILSWLLLGALHSTKGCCLPIPISCSNHMADYIHFVLVGFADQSKQSVVHMSALFHAFHLCQLWTIYCEQMSGRSEDAFNKAMENILNFWARVTPAILQLLSHSKVLADMVNLHFVNTMQALQQCNSAVLCQLYPMWQPILTAYHTQIPSQMRIKLDACENQPTLQPQPLAIWLKKVRYKISQIELQTSAASPFYNV